MRCICQLLPFEMGTICACAIPYNSMNMNSMNVLIEPPAARASDYSYGYGYG
jgi:hypothetical protein